MTVIHRRLRLAQSCIRWGWILGALGGIAAATPQVTPTTGAAPADPSAVVFDFVKASHGFGQLLPHTIFALDAGGMPTSTLIEIRTLNDLLANASASNPVRPAATWPTNALLPSGSPGNHFVYARFTQPLDIASVLDSSPAAQANSGLTGAITVIAHDPSTGAATLVHGRAFVGGRTYAGLPSGNPPMLSLQHWFSAVNGLLVPSPSIDNDQNSVPDGLGFPGTLPGTQFHGDELLADPNVFVFVPDADGDLLTYETFPAQREIKLRISTAVRSQGGDFLSRRALACATVGVDTLRPEVGVTPPPTNAPLIEPAPGASDVDPSTTIRIEFTEAIQPLSLGSLPTGAPPLPSSAITVRFGPAAQPVLVPFTVAPVSVLDLSYFELVPAFPFPGDSAIAPCGVFNHVEVFVNPAQVQDLAANFNLLGAASFFTTGEGPGLVNAPVTPDAIYLGRAGANPGLSVIDLNGFGASTGYPGYHPTAVIEGNTNYPNNPNVKLQGALMRPPLFPGTCTFNGGSAGVFTLTKDSSLSDLVLRAPLVQSIGDMMLGHALDRAFNNGPAPFGCLAGGGNLCAFDGKKIINPLVNGNTMAPGRNGQINGLIGVGAENLACWAPHPNPPPLLFPPLCVTPFLGVQEPTSIDSALPPPGAGLSNLLVPGDYAGNPGLGIPPTGLLSPEQNAFFQGPGLPQPTILLCSPYMVRGAIGHFLYVIDRLQSEVVVLNSNRMLVIDRIPVPDPTTLAMSPNLTYLAVTNQLTNSVSFIDIDPSSATFHTVVKETAVGLRPRGIAWEPDNEDILVCNELEGSLSILAAATLEVRKVVTSYLNQPFDVAITPRQQCFGYSRDTYFAYILNRNGTVAVFESGPNGVNGWGYDDVIGRAPAAFLNPQSIQPDLVDLRSAVWITHQHPLDGAAHPPTEGALSKLVIESAVFGILPLVSGSPPHFRDMSLAVPVSLGETVLSGVPVGFGFDDLRSRAGLPNLTTPFSAGPPLAINGKQLVRGQCASGVTNCSTPRYAFVAVPNPAQGASVVDVIRIDQGFTRIDTNAFHVGIQSIPAPGVQVVMDYYRQ